MHLAAGLSVGLTGIAAGYTIGIVGDAVCRVLSWNGHPDIMVLTGILRVCGLTCNNPGSTSA